MYLDDKLGLISKSECFKYLRQMAKKRKFESKRKTKENNKSKRKRKKGRKGKGRKHGKKEQLSNEVMTMRKSDKFTKTSQGVTQTVVAETTLSQREKSGSRRNKVIWKVDDGLKNKHLPSSIPIGEPFINN